MRGTRFSTGVIMMILCCCLAFGTVAAADSPSASIDKALTDTDGDPVDVVIRFEDTEKIGTKTVGSMKETVEQNTNKVESFAASSPGFEVNNELWLANAAVAEVDTSKTSLEEVASIDSVERLHPNFEVSHYGTVAEPSKSSPSSGSSQISSSSTISSEQYTYGLEQIDVPETWNEFGTRGGGTKVAVLDTGVNTSHPDIELHPGGWAEFDKDGNRVPGSEPYDSESPNGHGTHVSGTVAGNSSGTAIGVAPDAQLMHGLVLSDNGEGTFAQVTAGLQWAVDNNAEIVSMSLGSEGYEDAWIDPVRNAQSQGVLVVAASGNDGPGTSGSPGNVYDTLAVGATDEQGNVPDFSSGENVDTGQAWNSTPSDWPSQYTVPDLVAPGQSIRSANSSGTGYVRLSGTSMATPHVSGVAALMESATEEDLSPQEMKSALTKTSELPSGASSTRYGNGTVSAIEATFKVTRQQVKQQGEVRSPPECSTVSYNGDGSDSDPYKVTSVTQLQCIDNKIDKNGTELNFEQTEDIEATGTRLWNNNTGFEPIAEFSENKQVEFDGTYDGNGHTISGLTIFRPDENNTGLFAAIEDSARINNVRLKNPLVVGFDQVGPIVGFSDGGTILNSSVTDATVDGSERVSAFVGRSAGSNISDSASQGYVSGQNEIGLFTGLLSSSNITESSASGILNSDKGSLFIGGFVGRAEDSIILDSVSDVRDISILGHDRVGGFVGFNDATKIENSVANTSIETLLTDPDSNDQPTERRMGGFVGFDAGDILNSTANGELDSGAASSQVGGFAGATVGGSIQNSTADVDVAAGPSSENVGGLVGYLGRIASLSGSSAEGKVNVEESTNVGGLVGVANSEIVRSNASGDVTNTPIANEISDIGGLVGEANADVVRSAASGDVQTSNSEKVGGLIGAAKANVTRSMAYGNVSATASTDVGGLIGNANSVTTHSFATGKVTGYLNIGGLVGTNSGTVAKSNSTGLVNARGIVSQNRPRTNSIGGLIGSNSGTITSSYASVDVLTYEPAEDEDESIEDGPAATEVGGLVGVNTGTVVNSYAEGDVNDQGTPPERQNNVGGLIGSNSGTVNKTFAAGTVDGFVSRAGIVGTHSGSPLDKSNYWDKRTTTQNRSVGLGSGTLRSNAVGLGEVGEQEELDATEAMTGQDAVENMPELDFNSSTWNTVNESYPKLAWQGKNFQAEILNVSDVGITGTVEPKVRIESDSRLSDQQTVVANLTPADGNGTVSTDKKTLNLSVSEAAVETFELNTTTEDVGEHVVTVKTENSTDTARVNISSEPDFVIRELTTNSPVTENETIEIQADIANRGGGDEQTVVANLSGTGRNNETTLNLGPLESTTETFSIPTQSGDANGTTQQYRSYVRTDNDTSSEEVGVARDGVATVSVTDSGISSVGNTSTSFVSVSSEEAVVGINATVSVDTQNATITEVESLSSGNVNNATVENGTARFRYVNIRGKSRFTLGSVNISMTGDTDEVARISLEANMTRQEGFLAGTEPGTLRLGNKTEEGVVFSQPLLDAPGFVAPPANTRELDPTLYEDLDGDGSGTDTDQTVAAFGSLIRDSFPEVTEEQGRKLDWNDDGPEVTVQDMVALFGEQIRSG
jgi:subtilisin family serine protease